MDDRRLFLPMFGLLLLVGCNDTPSDPQGGSVVEEHDGGSAGADGLSGENYARAIFLKNRGLAHLENKEWTDADARLVELVEMFPENRLTRRNLAVARVLALVDRESPYSRSGGQEKEAAFDAAVEAAAESIADFRNIATKSYDQSLADLLEGKLRVHAAVEPQDFEEGLRYLKSAADAHPDAADFRFAVAMAMDGDREYSNARSEKSAELLEQLQRSFELAPKNLFALQKLLQRQALFLRSEVDATKQRAAELPETLKSAVALLQPFNESIRKQRRIDLIDTINKALESLKPEAMMSLMQPAMVTANLLLPEIATQIDQRRLNRNLLEYVLWEFDDEFLQAAATSGAIPEPDPTVIKSFLAADNVPTISGITDVEFQDMNLDGFDDLVVVRGGVVEIYTRGTDLSAEWKPLTTFEPPGLSITDILLIDLDRDYDKAISDVKSPWLLRDKDGDQKIVTDPAGKNRWYDADLDIVAWGRDGVVVLKNNTADDGARVLEQLPQDESVTQSNDVKAADLEMDGDLDLVFATDGGMTLWQNLDGATFANMNGSASLPSQKISSLRIGNFNDDPAVDVLGVYATDDGIGDGVLENLLHGRFRWQESGDEPSLDVPFAEELQAAVSEDFDNDCRGDLLQLNETGAVLRRGLNQGYTDFSFELPAMVAATSGDFDDDGDLDIIGVADDTGALAVLINEGGNTNSWLDVVARAVPDDPQFPSNRVNMHAIGSTIQVRANGLAYSDVITEPRVHLGLGDAEMADVIRIIWTDGIPQDITVEKLLRRRIGILAPQILKGSCPYIYTWTGERFEFFSDCLWAAPLGLVQANGELAPTREWEHLLIPGEALVEKDGKYFLQLTEELWETAYFDEVKLTAIDHPADVEVFTNEKVGPPSLAKHRVHTVRRRRTPKSVVDSRGVDLMPGLARQDGEYVQPFEARILQGLTDEWFMEFDLGEINDPKNVRLFLTGWVFPTDTSLNLAIEQNSNLSPPAPPSIEVPASDGTWKTVRPFIGFPSGKTKAMVVDLSGIFEGSDYRFRLRSSMELYWDEAFFTVGEVDTEVVTQDCSLASADLHYRGFSRRTYADNALFRMGHAPEGYDYESLTTEPRWSPIAGRFTKYGLVTPLLSQHDDHMVVMGPGDELAVSFEIPVDPVPDGWKRDFVLRNVGFDKDADLNTIYGQSSEPFPFRGMTQYPFGADEEPNSPEEYQKHIDEWQTREYSQRSLQRLFLSSPR